MMLLTPTIFNSSDLLSACELPAGLELLAYRGSIAHGCHNPDPTSIDDIDLIGCAIGEPQHYIGLHEWGSRGTKEVKSGRYDCVFYELRKLVSLLLQGNPNVLSLLWTKPEHILLRNYIIDRLINSRSLFAGKHVYNAFAGYAHAQMEKMESRDPAELRQYIALTEEAKYRGIHPNHKGQHFDKPPRDTGESRDTENWANDRVLAGLAHFHKKGENVGYMGDKRKRLVLEHGFDCKNASHLIRLLRMCKEFMSTGELQVFRPDAAELLDIKHGKWSLDQVKQHAADLFAECKIAKDKSTLSEGPQYDLAEQMTIGIIQERLWNV